MEATPSPLDPAHLPVDISSEETMSAAPSPLDWARRGKLRREDIERFDSLPRITSFANPFGSEYEYLLAGLINIRAQQEGLAFEISSNVDDAGAIDDVVVRLIWEEKKEDEEVDDEEEEETHCITYFVQLKHFENNTRTHGIKAFTEPEGDFSIRQYFKHYKMLRETYINKITDVEKAKVSRYLENEFRIVTFSNMAVSSNPPLNPDTTHSQYAQHKRPNHFSPADITTKIPLHCSAHPLAALLISRQDSVLAFTPKNTNVWNLLDNDNKASQEDKRIYQEEFLPRLLIFSSQENVDGLKGLIEKELSKYFHLDSQESEDRLFNIYSSKLKRWREKRKVGDIISETTRVLQNSMKENLNKLFEDQLNQNFAVPLQNRLSFKPEVLTDIAKIIKEKEPVILEIPCLKMHERCLKILQTFKSYFRKHDILLVTEQSLQKYKVSVKNITKSMDSTGIVLIAVGSQHSASEILRNMRSGCECKFVFACGPQNKVISAENKQEIEMQENSTSFFKDEWCLDQLTEDCQKDILNCSIHFQGREMQLKDLESAWPSLKEDVDAEMLLALLAGNATMGAPLLQFEEFEEVEEADKGKKDCYIPRSLEHQLVLEEEVLYNNITSTNHFVLSMFPNNLIDEIRNKRGKRNEESMKKEEREETDTLHILCIKEERSIENDEREFKKICNSYQNHNINLLVYQKESIVWTACHGETLHITPYLACPGLHCRPSPLCNHTDVSECTTRMLLLSGEPGMGKSTFVSHLAKQEKDPRKWIVLLRLISHTKLLHSMSGSKEINVDLMLKLLAEAVDVERSSSIQATMSFLKKCLTETGYVSIYVDGVDEVCPSHKKTAMQILRLLRETPATRVWVTSRMHLDDDLREICRIEPFRLSPFTKRQQVDYIWSLVKHENVNRQGISTFVEEVNKLTGRNGRSICEIPLIANILAKVIPETFDFTTYSKHRQLINIFKLYQAFVAKKCGIYSIKYGIDPASSSIQAFQCQYSLMHSDCAMMIVAEVEGIVETYTLQYCLRNYKRILNGESTGIMNITDHIPHFTHYSFAEYFAAYWLKLNYLEQKFSEEFWRKLSPTLRCFFNSMLAEGHSVHEAAIDGDPVRLKTDMEHEGEDACRVRDEGGRTPLHLAAMHGNTEACYLLIEAGSVVSVTDEVMEWTALSYAEAAQHLSIANILRYVAILRPTGLVKTPLGLTRLQGAATVSGILYECKLVALLTARARQQAGLRFDLATNVAGARPFDDVLLRLYWTQDDGQERSVTYFVQLKYASGRKQHVEVGDRALTADRGDFSIKRFYQQLKVLKDKNILTANEEYLTARPHDEFRFVIFTNRKVKHTPQNKQVDLNTSFPFSHLFHSTDGYGGFSFTENDAAVWTLFDGKPEEYHYKTEFLPQLLILDGQCKESEFDDLIEREIQSYFETSHTAGLLQRYIHNLRRWHLQQTDSSVISEQTNELEDAMKEQLNLKF